MRSYLLRVTVSSALLICFGFSFSILPQATAQNETFVVNDLGDGGDAADDGNCDDGSGNCTLRAAIQEANRDADRDVISFANVPTTNGTATISLGSGLSVDEEIEIDGSTAPNYPSSAAGGPIVKLDGSGLSGNILWLDRAADESRIIGLALVNAPEHGIQVSGLSAVNDVSIIDCFVGIDVDGTTVLGNGSDGIDLVSDGSSVSGSIVSGNAGNGIYVDGDNNDISNNIIGLDADGTQPAGNAEHGVQIAAGTDNVVGYGTPDPTSIGVVRMPNTISANGKTGVHVADGASGNAILVNKIGTNQTGTSTTGPSGGDLGNERNGIEVISESNQIGHPNEFVGGNVVSGNYHGIYVHSGGGTTYPDLNEIQNNVIGLNIDEDAVLGNDKMGILIRDAVGTEITQNVIGGNPNGISIDGFPLSTTLSRTVVADNYIGTNENGADLGNTYAGITISGAPSDPSQEAEVYGNTVGYNRTGISFGSAEFHDVAGNFIGTNDAGDALPNEIRGILLGGRSSEIAVGPPDEITTGSVGNGNIVGHNDGPGIIINKSNDNLITNNYLGTDAMDGTNLGNSGPGIQIIANDNDGDNNVIGYSYGASFSDPRPGAGGDGNVIAHNGDDGVQISGSDNPQQNPVRGNAIYQNGAADNTEIGIDLGDDGLTANDNSTDDGDSGPNRLQNFPVINSLDFDSGNDEVTIHYSISTATTNADYGTNGLKVDFYAADSEASGEGKTYLGTQFYDSPGQEKQVVMSVPSAMTKDDHVVATVTDAAGNTSEFLGASQQLPVELASFNARADDRGITLSWKTTSETNNAGFTVEHRSANLSRRDASTEEDGTDQIGWQKIGFVESKAEGGTSTEASAYQFAVENLSPGPHQFRLKQVDLDGTTHVHEALSVKLQMTHALRLNAPSPNPVRDEATFSFAVKEQTETMIRLYNVLGQKVKTLYEGTPAAGDGQTLRLSTSGLTSGVYFLRLQAGGQSTTRKVTVAR